MPTNEELAAEFDKLAAEQRAEADVQFARAEQATRQGAACTEAAKAHVKKAEGYEKYATDLRAGT